MLWIGRNEDTGRRQDCSFGSQTGHGTKVCLRPVVLVQSLLRAEGRCIADGATVFPLSDVGGKTSLVRLFAAFDGLLRSFV